jgi:glutamine phosphoribosylpyrophosphate amidotransferase
LDDLVASVLEDRPDIEHMCAACFSGEYPTGDITPEMLTQIEEERTLQGK